MKFFRDSDDTTLVRWYEALSTAPPIDVPNVFYPRSWDYEDEQCAIGEIQGSFRSGRNRPPLPRPAGVPGRCGSVDQWSRGCSVLDPLPVVDPNTGLRVCCGPGIGLGRGGGLAGGGLVVPPMMLGVGGGVGGGRGLPFPQAYPGLGGALAGGTFIGAGNPYIGAGGALAGGTFASPIPVTSGAGGALAGGTFFGAGQRFFGAGGGLAGGQIVTSSIPTGGLLAWYRGGYQVWKVPNVTPAINGDPVASWSDQSSNHSDLLEPTSGLQGTFLTGQVAGKPALRFDASVQQQLNGVAASSFGDTTMYLVLRIDSTGSSRTNYANAQDFAVGDRVGSFTAGYVPSGDYLPVSNAGQLDGLFHLVKWQCEFNGSYWHSFLEIDHSTSGAFLLHSTLPSPNLTIGTGTAGDADTFSVAEWILYDHSQSSADLAAVDAYMASEYGL